MNANDIGNKILSSFLSHFPDAAGLAESFTEQCEEVSFKKGEYLKAVGKKEKWISLIISGSCAVFLSRDKRDICLDISLEGDFFFDYESFLSGLPSDNFTRALEPVRIVRIPIVSDIEMQEIAGLKEIMAAVSKLMFYDRQKRLIEILADSPVERYQRLLAEYPQFICNISTTVLASYLGISREHLSRIKSKEVISKREDF